MKRRQLLIGSLALGAAAGPLRAQTGGKLLTIVVPYPPGGISDGQARLIAPHLGKALGLTVVVENITGAAGTLAVQKMLAAPADGHTLMVVSASDAILAPLTIAGARYQAEDLRLLGNGLAAPTALLARGNLPAGSLEELLKLAATTELTYGSIGVGSMPHLTGEDFRRRTGARMLHVPYRGGVPLIQDLTGGNIDITFMPYAGPILGFVAQGKLKLIGMVGPTAGTAHAGLPSLTTHAQLKDINYPAWSSFAVPRSVPEEAAGRLNRALNDAMRQADVVAWVKTAGSAVGEPWGLAESETFYKAEIGKLRGLARQMDLKAQ